MGTDSVDQGDVGLGLHHVCVKTRDWEATMAFYQTVLGLPLKVTWRAAPARAAWLDAGKGNYVEVFEDINYTAVPNGALVHFAFRSERIDQTIERVRAAGAQITMEPKDLTVDNKAEGPLALLGPVPIRVAFCEGPNGEVIEFFKNART